MSLSQTLEHKTHDKFPYEEQQETKQMFQEILLKFKNQIPKNISIEKIEQKLTREDIINLFNNKGSYGKALRENRDKSHFIEGGNTKINLERVYKYIIDTCNSKDPNFAKIRKKYKNLNKIPDQFKGQNLYYRKIMVLNTFFVENYGLFFAFGTDHLALTPDPIIDAKRQQISKEQQTKIEDFMLSLGFEKSDKSIDYILVDGALSNTTIKAMYIVKNIFVFQESSDIGEEDINGRIYNECLHQNFEQKYGEKLEFRDIIQQNGKDYFMGSKNDGIFPNESRYSVTGHSAEEFLSDVSEMQLGGGKNQIDLRHKVYNLKNYKTCKEQYRNSVWLMTYIVNNDPEINKIYKQYESDFKDLGAEKSDEMLQKSLEAKAPRNGKEISHQEHITSIYLKKADELIKTLDDFTKDKKNANN